MNKQRKTNSSPTTVHQNDGFGSSLGFVPACVGFAMGMGNIWIFPYRVRQYGGGASPIPYILFIILLDLVGLLVEFAIRRRARTGALGAYEYCWKKIEKDRLGYFLGRISLLGSLGIAIEYAITVGRVVRAPAGSVTGAILTADAVAYFSQVTGELGSVPWHVLVMMTTAGILMFGATKGIEKINKVLMPSSFVLFAVLAIRVAFLSGVAEGYKFLFAPDWSDLLKVDTWVMIMGQAFSSLSITGSGMIVYGTYLAKTEDIPEASIRTAFFDTAAAMMAVLVIIPAVLVLGIEPDADPPLMFITLPGIFRQMLVGRPFAVIFFPSVAFASITSLINMFKAVNGSWQNRLRLPRKAAVALCSGTTLLVGIFLESESKMGSWMDFATIITVPFGAVPKAVSAYYVLGYKKIREELGEGRKKPLGEFFGSLTRYVYVSLAVVAFILGIAYDGIG